jgi:hypothetical protein
MTSGRGSVKVAEIGAAVVEVFVIVEMVEVGDVVEVVNVRVR